MDCGQLIVDQLDSFRGLAIAVSNTTYNNAAMYSCTEGYELVGEAVRVCRADGNWTREKPYCVTRTNGLTHMHSGLTYNELVFFYFSGTLLQFISIHNATRTLTLSGEDDASLGPIPFPTSLPLGGTTQTTAYVSHSTYVIHYMTYSIELLPFRQALMGWSALEQPSIVSFRWNSPLANTLLPHTGRILHWQLVAD